MKRLAAIALLLIAGNFAYALDVPPFTGLVVDRADLLPPQVEAKLSASLQAFQREKGPQIAVLTIPSLEGDALESYSIRVVEAWGIGHQDRDDGLLLLIAAEDRQMRIEVGQGLEGVLPDIVAGRIIRDVITPFFKQGQFSEGVVMGLHAVAQRLGGELREVPAYRMPTRSTGRGQTSLGRLIFLFILFFVILPRFFGHRYRRPDRGLLAGALLGGALRRGHRRGGWTIGGGGGGGGFGGFGGFGGGGGGGFSGGGASGRW